MKQKSVILAKSVSAARLCVVLLGAPGVGKTALLVRYLTRRYIGEYLSGSDIIYQQYVPLLKKKIRKVDFLDTSSWEVGEDRRLPELHYRTISYIIVYSTVQQESFATAEKLLAALPERSLSVLLGNKSDLEHRKQVPTLDGQRLAKQYNSSFFEVSAAEERSQLTSAFSTIIRRSILDHSLAVQPPFSISIASKLLKFITKRSEKRNSRNARKKLLA